jgi:thiamine biosynthesis lipoprotein
MQKRLTVLLLCGLMLSALAGCTTSGAASPDGENTAEIYAMDTVMDLTAYGDHAAAALKSSEKKINTLEALLSRTKEDSEVSKLNRAGGTPTLVDGEVQSLISRAAALSAVTDGAFDITIAPVVSAWGFTTDSYQVPPQAELDELLTHVSSDNIDLGNDGVTLKNGATIDLGGIAKGYTSDCVAEIFLAQGIESGKISLGGNVYVRGNKPDGSAWRVGVQDPANSEGYAGILSLTDAFAVTSGGYQRYFEQGGKTYHHIIDPKTGYPAENGLVSVTVVMGYDEGSATGSGTICDAFSTALFVMGTDGALDFWRTNKAVYDFDLVLVTDDGRVLVTSGVADQFEEIEDSGYTYEIVS